MTTRTTGILEAHSRSQLRHAVQRLLHRLKPFVRVYPKTMDDKMPDHDIAWVTGVDGGPEQTIADALICTPELWAAALPKEVCIVPREALSSVAGGPEAVDYLSGLGASIVSTHGAKRLFDLEDAERAKLLQRRQLS
jgi:hypothetical protein